MNSEALIMMVSTQVVFTLITGYFFFKVLRAPKNEEPDSFSENENEQ